MTTNLHAFLTAALQRESSSAQIIKLFGQASARQYFRATFPDASLVVIMKLPAGFSSPAEEITKIAASFTKNELPFLNIQSYLHRIAVRVPKILGIDADAGLILLEDLGDLTLEKLVADLDSPRRITVYTQVLKTLIHLQTQTQVHTDLDCMAFHRRFDEDLLNWEFDHFWEYGIADRLGRVLPEVDRLRFCELTRPLTQKILKMPQGFVHRDFQSRNVMYTNGEFVLIDFQDALQGPILYDLVALLRDSYQEFSMTETDVLLKNFWQQLPTSHPYFRSEKQLREDFFTLTIHRKLKDAGRFQYIHTVRGNPNFLVHVPLSLAYVKEALEQVPEGKSLLPFLASYLRDFS